MPKYYIQSGSFGFITTAPDAHSAALWAIHCFLDARAARESSAETDDAMAELRRLVNAESELQPETRISERGPGLQDAAVLDTASVIDEWIQLTSAFQRLESMLS